MTMVKTQNLSIGGYFGFNLARWGVGRSGEAVGAAR